jgi:hypothetical protein
MVADISRLFVSYSRTDAKFALKLATDLRSRGTDLWLDQLDIPTGAHWDSDVEEALRESAGILVILSPAAVASHNVMDEVAFALSEGKRIFPIRYKACTLPFRLRRLQYVDFVTSYDEGLHRLLSDLSTTTSPPSDATGSASQPESVQAEEGIGETDPPLAETNPQPFSRLRVPASVWKVIGGLAVAIVIFAALSTLTLDVKSGSSEPAYNPPASPSAVPPPVAGMPGSDPAGSSPAAPFEPPPSKWTPGAKDPANPHVVAGAKEGEWIPENGYKWVDGTTRKVEWSPGKPHATVAHVLASSIEGEWTPQVGYLWVNRSDLRDLRVEWQSGQADKTRNLVASATEGQWEPAPGYEWADTSATSDLRVTWKPGKLDPKRNLIALTQENQWQPAPGFEWLNETDTKDLRVRPK